MALPLDRVDMHCRLCKLSSSFALMSQEASADSKAASDRGNLDESAHHLGQAEAWVDAAKVILKLAQEFKGP